MVLLNLFAGMEWRLRYREWTCGHRKGRRERVEWTKTQLRKMLMKSGNKMQGAQSAP